MKKLSLLALCALASVNYVRPMLSELCPDRPSEADRRRMEDSLALVAKYGKISALLGDKDIDKVLILPFGSQSEDEMTEACLAGACFVKNMLIVAKVKNDVSVVFVGDFAKDCGCEKEANDLSERFRCGTFAIGSEKNGVPFITLKLDTDNSEDREMLRAAQEKDALSRSQIVVVTTTNPE